MAQVVLLAGPPYEIPIRRYLLSQAEGRIMKTVDLVPEGAQLLEADLSAGVVEIILNSRAPFMRRMYGLRGFMFVSPLNGGGQTCYWYVLGRPGWDT